MTAWERHRWRAALGSAFLGGFLSLTPAALARQPAPSPEQLLAATLRAADLTSDQPGGWWDDAPEFNDRLEPDSGADAVTAVTAHVFGKPDTAPAEVATSLHLYAEAAAAANGFDATAGTDKADFGAVADGPKIGDQSRYLRQAADGEHGGGAALRFQFGRYLARIDVGGDASTIAADRLAALGKIVVGRLSALDAGTLDAPALPELAAALPPADTAFTPVLGTAALSSETWSWIWSNQRSSLVVSGRLRAVLRDGVDGETAVMRRYGLAANSSHVAEVTLMPFKSGDAAGRYLVEIKREDARRDAIANDEGDVTVISPIPDVSPAYRADLRVGRYVAEVVCLAPFAPTSSACETTVRDLAERVKKSLPAK
jgi:hypothetical protein